MNEHESAKEVAGKAIGKHGLIDITIIVAMGVGASIVLEESRWLPSWVCLVRL